MERCRHNGWTPCVYEGAEEALPVYRRLGLRSLKMAEEAIVDLASFSLAGGKRAALRSMVHKVTRMGLAVRPYERAKGPEPAFDEQLEEISEQWLAEKRLGEMGFSLGRFSLETLDEAFVFLCMEGERVVAFTSWRPYRAGRAAVLDLMRKRKEVPSGTMDLLVSRSLEELKAAGLEEASLANAPLANVGEPRRGLERGVDLLFENLNAFYGYKNLFQFKKKFAPRWESRYLVYPGGPALPAVAYAITSVHGTGGLRNYHQVLHYIANPLMFAIECMFLLALSIHAMLGIRSIVRDFDLKPRTIRRIERGLWALGTVTAAYGIVLLSILAARA